MGGTNKLLLELKGRPVLIRTLEKFAAQKFVDKIVITAPKDLIEKYSNLCREFKIDKVCAVVEGGKERQDSIFAALKVLQDKGCHYVAVHDAARPLTSTALIAKLYVGMVYRRSDSDFIDGVLGGKAASDKCFLLEDLDDGSEFADSGVLESGLFRDVAGVIPAVAVKDTIKRVGESGIVEETLNRSELQAVQTPQIFEYDTLVQAYSNAFKDGYVGTDDSSLVERLGRKVMVMPGEYTNLKITTIDDISLAAQIIEDMEHA
ncbi:2-C-methyl-D-erythritol 4-phosphate cytidylyltransferase [bacterium]|nr:2-C-methyl-D-erythritol 4-phosphate cytidylyltransferase [bacterium]